MNAVSRVNFVVKVDSVVIGIPKKSFVMIVFMCVSVGVKLLSQPPTR